MQAPEKMCSEIAIPIGFFKSSDDPTEICSLYKILPRPFILPLSARFVLIVTEFLGAFADRQLPTYVSVILLNCSVPSSSSVCPYYADYAKLWMEESISGFIKEIA